MQNNNAEFLMVIMNIDNHMITINYISCNCLANDNHASPLQLQL